VIGLAAGNFKGATHLMFFRCLNSSATSNKPQISAYRTMLVFAAFILSCVCSQAQQPKEEVRTGAISGRVVSESGEPLAGAAVFVRAAGLPSSGRSTTSNLEGDFRLQVLRMRSTTLQLILPLT
jgi:hypothetical protein